MTSILTNAAHQALDPAADLDAKLKAFDRPPIQATVRPNPLAGAAQPEQETNEELQEQATEDTSTEGIETSSEAVEGDDGEQQEGLAPEFAQAFESYFGLKPDEALDTVNQLVAFRDEITLMRQWGVDPTGYDQRMAAVREFYNTLPEDGRDQFNSVEGAAAIWEHLQKNGQATTTTKRTSSTKPASRIKQASTPKQEFIKKSDILKMDTATYQKNLPKITKAFREGRVIQDA